MQSPTRPDIAYVPLAEDVARSTIRKLDRRFLLLLTGVAFLSYVDRSNVGYAANDLCQELNLTNEAYGRGVSLFYVGYLLSQVAGNVMLKRFGAPAWMSFILFVWGCVAAALGFIQNTTHFYILRFALGIAEGSTFPAMWYIIPLFYPPDHVTNACSIITSAVSFSMPLSSPLSAGLLSLGPYVPFDGWRLLFIVEGIMPMLYAVVLYLFLPATPETASFLEAEEKEWIAVNQGKHDSEDSLPFWEEMKRVVSNRSWWMFALCALINFGTNSVLMFWATLIIQDILYGEDDDDDEDSETCGSKHANAALAILLTAIPFLVSGISCLLIRLFTVRDRTRVAAIICTVGGLLMISWIGAQHTFLVLIFLLLTCAIASGYIVFPFILGLAITSCDTSIYSVAASMLNTVATVGAIVFPMIFGIAMDRFGSAISISMFGGFLLVIALIMVNTKDPLLKRGTDRERERCFLGGDAISEA